MYRLKHSFSSGEVSPLIFDRTDFERYKNGCRKLYNAMCLSQGPAGRRSGFRFVYDLNAIDLDPADPRVRLVPFVFSRTQAYVLVFFVDTEGDTQVVFATPEGLVVYDDPPITKCPPGSADLNPAPVAGDIVILTMPAGFDLEAFDYAQSADELYITQSGLEPHIITRYSHTCWTISDVTTALTDMPSNWSDEYGWPERVTFHQQRLVFAANLLRGTTVWMSRAGDFNHFGQAGATVVDADAVTFTIASGTQNKIVWIASGKALFLGTIGDEWTVQGSTQPALTPNNILAIRQTNNGSEAFKPVLVNLSTLFIERHGRTMNEFVYDYTFDSYKTSDLSIASTHVTDDYSIVDWSYQRTPDSIIWCVREDGDLLGLTFQREHKVIGWHHHETQGAFKAIATIPGNQREDEVFVIVKRIIDGDDKYYLETMAPRFQADDPEWGRFLDSHVVYQGTAVSSLSGLDHLVGEEVSILADGMVLPVQEVSSGGTVTLGASYSHVVVGLNYESIIIPILSDIEQRQEGTLLSRTGRIVSIAIDFYKSLGCTVGSYDEEGNASEDYIPFRMPYDTTGEQIPLFSGWRDIDFQEGHTNDPNYYIKQTQPLPMTVRAVVDTIEVGD